MKRILSISGILALAILFMSAISIRETPQDPPRGKKAKKHIKVVKLGDDGKKVEIDTVIEGDNVFVFNGDTLDGTKEMKWVSEGDFDFDMDMDFDIDVKEDGNGKVVIVKSDKDGKSMVREFKIDGDSSEQIRVKVIANGDCKDVDVMKWHHKGGNEMFFGTPHAPNVIRIEKRGGNVIDLSDPGIISFEKKDLKDGKEKIVIVREKISEAETEIHEEIIMHGGGAHPMIIHEGHPHKVKKIKVIADEDGKVEIIEDGDEDVQVIEEGGKKIIIKKRIKGEETEVEVEVEEEEHDE